MPLRLGDYADEGDWYFIAVCGACGRGAISLRPPADEPLTQHYGYGKNILPCSKIQVG